jgi:anionic cell wall polymer biosynthesis LytR-Cps2A-Psr (LCP) family protein
VKVVDAIGGVTIDVPTELPMPSQMRCSNYILTPTIGPGEIYMDGTKALGYVRSRLADSDYQRMERQRILLQTIVDEVGFTDLLTNFGELVDAIEDNVHTSMTVDEARRLLSVLQSKEQLPASIGMAPPLFDPSDPNFDQLRSVMQALRRALVEGTPLDTFGADTTTDTTP